MKTRAGLSMTLCGVVIALSTTSVHAQQITSGAQASASGHAQPAQGLPPSLSMRARGVTRTIPSGWEPFYPGGPDGLPGGCDVGIDRRLKRAGIDNMTVKCQGRIGRFGGLTQGFSAASYRGKRVRLSGALMAEDIEDVLAPRNARDHQGLPARDAMGVGGLWLRVGSAAPTLPLVVDNMRERGLRGTMEWTTLESVVDVPEDAVEIRIGFWMQGRGQLWVTNLKFEEVGYSVPVTASGAPAQAAGPSNLELD